jgi:MSHA biogenesis protein MshI
LPVLNPKGLCVFSFKRAFKTDSLCALVPHQTGTAFANVQQQKTGRPLLLSCGFQPLLPDQDIQDNLKQVVQKQGLGKVPCSTVLDISDYQLMMVEAPEVPQAELRAAIRWRIRDLIDFHIDDAVLDVFDAPPSGARGIQDHLYVVVSRAASVKQRVETLQNAGAALQVIDIPELALRNIAARLEQDKAGLALLYFEAERGVITLSRDATLYLARSLDIGYRDLIESPALVDRLALELQRSMDYYDRHFQQAPVNSIVLCPLPQPAGPLAEQLQQQTGIEVQSLQLEDIVDFREPLPADQAAECLLAIGAALRSESAQL